jgi:hypothetical protein
MNPIDIVLVVVSGVALIFMGYAVGVHLRCRRVIRMMDEVEAQANADPVFGGVTVENGVTMYRGKPMAKDGAK